MKDFIDKQLLQYALHSSIRTSSLIHENKESFEFQRMLWDPSSETFKILQHHYEQYLKADTMCEKQEHFSHQC